MLPAAAHAQGASAVGDITGTISDLDGAPLPGVTVTIEGENLIQEARSVFSGGNGVFRALNLRPGTYTVSVALEGFRTLQYEVIVTTGAVADMAVTMQVAGIEETVQVISVTPMIETTNAQVQSSFNADLIEAIPIAREFIAVGDITAGFTDRGAYGAGGNTEGRYRRGAATNSYTINGVDVTEPDWGNTWVNPSIDSIEEIQVVGVGASAEYGNFSGATMNLVTKSGTNSYRGSLSYFYQDGGLRGENDQGVPEYTRGPYNYDHTLTGAFGGPILKNKVLFFASIGYSTVERLPFDPDPHNTGVDPNTLTFETTARNNYHGRIDWLLNDRNTIGFMYNTDPASDRGLGQGPGTGPEIGASVDFGSSSWLASWQSEINDDTYLDVRYAGYKGNNRRAPITCCDVTPFFDYVTDIQYQTSGFLEDEENGRNEIKASLSHYAEDFLGVAHDIKVGAEYEDTWSLFLGKYTGVGGADDSWIGIYPYYGYTYVYGYTYSAHLDAEVKRFSAYVQDDIRVSNRVTLNLGLRYDNPKIWDVWDARNGTGPRNQLTDYSYLAPRIGASWDVTGDARVVAHGSWGRYFDKALTFGPIGAAGNGYDSANWYITYTDVPWDPNNIDPAFWESIAFLPENLVFDYGIDPYDIDPDLEGAHTDILNVGVEVEVANDWVVGLEWIHKNDKNMVVQVDRTTHTYQPFEYTDPLGGKQTLYSRTDSLEDDFWVTNDDFYFRDHDLVTLSLDKRFSRAFGLSTSITYQDSRGNIENNIGAVWGYGARASNATNPNFNGHPYDSGQLSYNRKWQFKLLANYNLPWGISASGYLQAFSGRPWTPTISAARLPQPLNEPFMFSVGLEPRGNRTRDPFTQLDLRLQKDITFGSASAHRIELVFDAFNIFNSNSTTGIHSGVNSVWPIQGGSSFAQPSGIIRPRQLRLGFRYVF